MLKVVHVPQERLNGALLPFRDAVAHLIDLCIALTRHLDRTPHSVLVLAFP